MMWNATIFATRRLAGRSRADEVGSFVSGRLSAGFGHLMGTSSWDAFLLCQPLAFVLAHVQRLPQQGWVFADDRLQPPIPGQQFRDELASVVEAGKEIELATG